MRIERPDASEADRIADCWVRLARGQRAHGSHLAADANRTKAREAVAGHVATGGLLVAREDGAIVGFVMYGLSTGAYEQDVARGMVHNLWVAPDSRDRGVGSALLARAEAELGERGADVVALEVMADNEAARRFYRRVGYRPHRVELEKSLTGAEPPEESDTDSSPG